MMMIMINKIKQKIEYEKIGLDLRESDGKTTHTHTCTILLLFFSSTVSHIILCGNS